MKWLAVLLVVILAPLCFVYSLIMEQRTAIRMAYLDSFAATPRIIKDILKGEKI